MSITQVGVATLSEELLQYIKDQIKNGTLSFTDLIDGPEYAGQDGKFLQAYSGSGSTGMQWQDLPSAGLNWQVEDTDFLAQDKIGILASNGITITLPSDPEEGNLVAIADHNSEFDVTPVTVVGSGGYLIEDESDLVLDLRNAYVQLIFDGTKWEIAQVNHPFNIQEITEETFPSGQISYTLSRIPPSRSSILVTSGGKIIPTSQYSLVGNVLSFGAVASDIIQVRHIGVPKATEVSDTPVGAMLYFPNSEPVDGWLDCNGSSISASVYPDLVKFLTKNPQAEIAYLPDARGNFIRTFDYGNGTDVIAPHSIDNILKDNKWGRWISTTNEATSENLWDGSTATRTTVLVSQGYIGYRFDAPVTMTEMILNNNDAIGTQHLPDTGIVRASHDGITWVDASNTVTLGATSQGRNTTFTVTTNDAYRFWSIHGTGGQPYADGSGEYWGVTSLYMNGSSTNRIVGGFQEQSVGPMPATTLGGTAAGTLAVASGAGANVLGQGGSGQVSGGGETRPDNQSYVLRIKAFHYQSGDLASTDVTALRDEVSRLSGQVNDGTSYVGPDAPENPSENARWYDTTSGRTYIWFNDGDSYQWVDDSPQAASTAQESLNAAEILSIGSTTPRALNERFSDVVNVLDFGAVGDGVTDDTAAIQSAIDASEGLEVLLPCGVYKTTTSIHINKSITLLGDSATIKASPTAYHGITIAANTDAVTIRNLTLKNTTDDSGTTTAYAITAMDDVTNCKYQDCIFDGWTGGLALLIRNDGILIENCTFRNMVFVPGIGSGGYGVLIEAGRNTITQGNTFEETVERHHLYYGVNAADRAVRGYNHTVVNNTFLGDSKPTRATGFEYLVKFMSTDNVTITGNTFNGGVGHVWITQPPGSDSPSGYTITGNAFRNATRGNSTNNYVIGSEGESGSSSTITNVVIDGNSLHNNDCHHAMKFDEAISLLISDNQISGFMPNIESGINIQNSSSDVTIQDNAIRMYNGLGRGIFLNSTGNSTNTNTDINVHGNIIRSAIFGIFFSYCPDIKVLNNHVDNCSDTFIYNFSAMGNDSVIAYNILTGAGSTGINVTGASDQKLRVYENDIQATVTSRAIFAQGGVHLVKPIGNKTSNSTIQNVETWVTNSTLLPPATNWNVGDRVNFLIDTTPYSGAVTDGGSWFLY